MHDRMMVATIVLAGSACARTERPPPSSDIVAV
jgi:hypothetical protein